MQVYQAWLKACQIPHACLHHGMKKPAAGAAGFVGKRMTRDCRLADGHQWQQEPAEPFLAVPAEQHSEVFFLPIEHWPLLQAQLLRVRPVAMRARVASTFMVV